jgi:hypothetical protein
MAQTHTGITKIQARKFGITIDDYLERCKNEKWCTGCKEWHNKSAFGPDSTRFDGLASYCKLSRNHSIRKYPQDKKQILAHRLIQMRVMRGKLDNPNSIPCMDCGHTGNDRRHEYDHYLGYDTQEARGLVQAVCSICHRKRERIRRNGSDIN